MERNFTVLNTSVAYCNTEDSIIFDHLNRSTSTSSFRRSALDWTQLCVTTVGFLANFTVFVTLKLNGNNFTSAILLLLKHQAIVDSFACITALLLLVQRPMWASGHIWLDHIVCHIWHSQFLYWTCVFLSGWNLGCIALERYIAVCKPLRHQYFGKRHIFRILGTSYVFCFLLNSLTLFQTSLQNGHCISKYFFKGTYAFKLYQGYAFIVFLTQYALPCLLFFIFYGSIVVTLRRRIKEHILPGSPVICKATMQLTKTAVTVTIVFIISLGYDLWYYILGYSGVFEYRLNSPLQVS